MNDLTASVPSRALGFVMTVVWPLISMMHSDSRATSRLLNGRTRTATFTEDIVQQFQRRRRKSEEEKDRRQI